MSKIVLKSNTTLTAACTMNNLLLLTLLIVPISTPAITGTQAAPYLDNCASGLSLKDDDSFLCGYVHGLIKGVREMPAAVAAYNNSQTEADILQPFCVPPDISNPQLIGDLKRYIDRKPALSHEEIYTLLNWLLAQKYPCD